MNSNEGDEPRLFLAATAFWRVPDPGSRMQRESNAIAAVGTGLTFGAAVGHLVPLVREGRIELASETAPLNLGDGALLLALGSSLLRHHDSGDAP
jgi:hypothetical protein